MDCARQVHSFGIPQFGTARLRPRPAARHHRQGGLAMSDLIALGCPDEQTAARVRDELVRLQKDYLEDAAIIRRNSKGELHVTTPAHHAVAGGTVLRTSVTHDSEQQLMKVLPARPGHGRLGREPPPWRRPPRTRWPRSSSSVPPGSACRLANHRGPGCLRRGRAAGAGRDRRRRGKRPCCSLAAQALRAATFSPCRARCARSESSRRPWRSPWPTWRGRDRVREPDAGRPRRGRRRADRR